MRQQARDSLHNETDCQVFEVWTSGVRPDKLHLHEVRDDAGAFDLHLKSAHYRSFDADI